MKRSGKSQQKIEDPFVVHIDDLTHAGRGVAHRDGKAVFVDGGLPGEEVECVYTVCRSRLDEAQVTRVLESSPERVEPRCRHFAICGGCSLQHLASEAQLVLKQGWLLSSLLHIGKVQPEQVLPPMTGPLWAYRRRARLGVKWVAKKGRVLVGFRERSGAFIADLQRCEVLDERVGGLLEELARLIETLSIRDRLPQIEVAGGDERMSLNLRVLTPPNDADLAALRAFGQRHGLVLYLQPGGPDSVQLLGADPEAPLASAEQSGLSYRLPAFDLELEFQPWHFIRSTPSSIGNWSNGFATSCKSARKIECWTCFAVWAILPWPWPVGRGRWSGWRAMPAWSTGLGAMRRAMASGMRSFTPPI